MTARIGTIIATVLCALLLLPQVAQAKSRRERARHHFETGAAFYKDGAYRAAIREFQKADGLDPSPLLSFNMGICHEKLGEGEEAVRLFRVYLRRRPAAPNKQKVEKRIAKLEASIAASKAPAYELLEDADVGTTGAGAKVDPTTPSGTVPVKSGVTPVNNARRLDPRLAGRMAGQAPSGTVPAESGAAVNNARRLDPLLAGRMAGQAPSAGGRVEGPGSAGPAEAAPASGANPAQPGPPPGVAAGAGAPPTAAGPLAPPVRDKPKKKPVYKSALFWGVVAVSAAILISIAVKRSESSNSQALMLGTGSGNQGGAVLIRF